MKDDIERRLEEIESRLDDLERKIGSGSGRGGKTIEERLKELED